MDAWSLTYEAFAPADEGQQEALCTLGNGYMATRGAVPESHAGGAHYPGTYAAGCYNRLSDVVSGHDIENESLVNLPNWLVLTVAARDGEWLGEPGTAVLDQRRELDLRHGLLTRWLRFADSEGHTTRVVERRFVHLEQMHVCGLHLAVTAENWSGVLRLRSALDGTVRNTGVERYRDLSDRHLVALRAESVAEDTLLLETETSQSRVRVAQAARTRLFSGGRRLPAAARETRQQEGWIGQDLAVAVRSGQEINVEKLVTLYTSRDRAISAPALEAVDWLGGAPTFDQLLAQHRQAWERLWDRFRFRLDGDGAVLRVVRLHLFHLLQTLANSADLDVGVPARGLHGEAYRGHVLWDELFVFPLLNMRAPTLSRSLLLYRYRRLPWARRAAREAGCPGAMYPWQSGSDGREESQRWHLNPVSGNWTADPTCLQRHVGLAIAYNVWQYYQVTQDREFLADYGAEMLLEIARFFAGLATYDEARDRYVIRGVMGPDEFHTGYPGRPDAGIDNNAYTNVMTSWLLLRALDALALLPCGRRTELSEALGLGADEAERWARISRRMYVPFHDDGIISQFEGYELLTELDWDGYRARHGDIQRLDRILAAEGDSANHYQVSKQADALMLFYLHSAGELGALFRHLGYALTADTIRRTTDYYLARTSHGSTLSAVVHAWVLARAHRDQALDYFVRALDSDITDIQGGTTAEGIHLAAMAGSVDLLQRCFAGVETRFDALWLNPFWPPELGTLEFGLWYRGHGLTLRINGRRLRVLVGAGDQPPITLNCHGQVVEIAAGGVATFSRPAR